MNIQHDPTLGAPEELAAGYLVGALALDESIAFERHVDEGCGTCLEELANHRETADALARAVREIAPRPELRDLVLAHAKNAASAQVALRGAFVVPQAARLRFQPTLTPGITAYLLRPADEEGRVTALLRFEPGASVPAHGHEAAEEIFILEGDYEDENGTHHAGDYLYSPKGGHHAPGRSPRGCLALVIGRLSILAA